MKNIENYLKKQIEISKELNEILVDIDMVEYLEKEALYEENRRLLNELNSVNNQNINAMSDRIDNLKNRVEVLLKAENTQKDVEFKKYLNDLNIKLSTLSIKFNSMNNELNKEVEKHNNYIKKLDSQKLEQPKTKTSEPKIEPVKIENHKMKVENKPNTYNDEEKFEFKVGSNMLNVLGVIMILIAIITFGKYIYTNYMTDMLKGVFLFAISSLILVSGETIFSKKNTKFAIGISALGVGALYSSLVINYLFLETINSLMAIILTIVITGVSLMVSSKNNSDIIRILALIGGYGCLVPTDYLTTSQSYITVAILLIISFANIYIPINKPNFSIYSSVLNIVFCTIINFTGFLELPAIIIYFTFTTIFNNLMYIKLCRSNYNERDHILAIITTICLMTVFLGVMECSIVTVIINVLIILTSYLLANKKLRSAYYSHGIYILLYLCAQGTFEGIILDIILVLITISTFIMICKSDDLYFKLILIILITIDLINFIEVTTIIAGTIYVILFSSIIWLLSDKYKNEPPLILLKNSYVVAFAIVVYSNMPFEAYINSLLAFLVLVIYVIKLTHIEKIRHDNYKNCNKFILVISLILLNITMGFALTEVMLSLALSTIMLVLLISPKYVESNFIKIHKILICSLYITYGIIKIYYASEINTSLLSIILILFAFINVYIGFRKNISEVRKYGLILSLIICAKLVFIDSYSYDFIIKAVVFLMVGIVVLSISYIYNKLEQEANNKNKIDD